MVAIGISAVQGDMEPNNLRMREDQVTPFYGKRRAIVGSNRMVFILGAASYVVLLQAAYILGIVPSWSYLGFVFKDPPAIIWLLGTLAAIAPSIWMPISLHRPSQWLYLFLYLSVYVPGCFMPFFRAAGLGQPTDPYLPMIATLFGCMALLQAQYSFPQLRLPEVRIRPPVFWSSIMIGTIVAYAIVYKAFSGGIQLVGSEEIARHRLEGREIIADSAIPAIIVGYCMTYVSNVINPLLMTFGLWYRRPGFFLFGAAGQIFFYAVNAARAPLATVVLLVLLFISVRQNRVSFPTLWVWSVALIAALCAVSPQLPFEGAQNLISWAVMRTFIVPGYLIGVYHDFFTANPHTFFSHITGFGWIHANPYQGKPLGLVIGASLGRPDDQENANLWADGFASFGYLGMLIVTVLLAATFYLFDAATRRIDPRIPVVACGVQGLIITNLPIFTAFLGSGFCFAIILFYLIPKQTQTTAVNRREKDRRVGHREFKGEA